VRVSLGDYKRLKSGVYLNDNLIDFYLKYSMNRRIENLAHTLSDHTNPNPTTTKRTNVTMETYATMPKELHIFSSHFFSALTDRKPQNILDVKGIYIFFLEPKLKLILKYSLLFSLSFSS
jgi:hypothetical protein